VVIDGRPLAWGITATLSTALGAVALFAAIRPKRDSCRTRLAASEEFSGSPPPVVSETIEP
jgi:hypothetical protein